MAVMSRVGPGLLPLLFLIAASAPAAEPVVNWDAANAEMLQHFQAIVRINTSNPPGNETAVVNKYDKVPGT